MKIRRFRDCFIFMMWISCPKRRSLCWKGLRFYHSSALCDIGLYLTVLLVYSGRQYISLLVSITVVDGLVHDRCQVISNHTAGKAPVKFPSDSSILTHNLSYFCEILSDIETVKTSWWRHQMETFSALLALCAGNSPVTVEFPLHRQVTRSFDVFFDLRLNKRLSKQSWGW